MALPHTAGKLTAQKDAPLLVMLILIGVSDVRMDTLAGVLRVGLRSWGFFTAFAGGAISPALTSDIL